MKTGTVVVIGLISAGLVIGGTVWYFNSKKPKKSSDSSNDEDNKSSDNTSKGEDIPDATNPVSSSSAPSKHTSSSTSTASASNSSSGGSASKSSTSNVIDEVKAKLGAGARVKDNQVFAPFNSNKNIAVFYSNGRFSIFKIGEEKKGYLIKGSFKNSGLTLTPDKGKAITSGSVWNNLNRLPIKK